MGLSHSPKVISDGLVLYLDATNTRSYSGTGSSWYDLSVYGNNSTLVSSPTFINNKYGQLALNGSTQYSSVPYNSTLWNGQTYTLSLWAKKIGLGDGGLPRGIMISKDANYIDHAYNGKTMASFRNNTGQQTLIYGNNPASYNEWRHYAFTYDGTIGILYENGAATGSTALVGNNVNSSVSPLNIGRWDGSSIYFNGCIASSMVYNRALNADEILQNYNATKYKYILKENIVTNGLILNYDMSDYRSNPFTGTSITDLSGIGNTGTLTNGPAFSSLNGGIISFDGTNDLISIGTRPSIDGYQLPITLSGWFNLNSLSGNKTILGIYNGVSTIYNYLRIDAATFRFFLSIDGALYPATNSGQYQYFDYSTSLVLNTWYNFAVVVGGTLTSPTLTIYINSVPQTFSPVNLKSSVTLNQDYRIGANQLNYENFNGYIAQVQIHNRVLTAQEILQNYNASKTRFGIS